MRKGVFVRLSIVVLALSLLSFIPFLRTYYLDTVPYAYLCMEDFSSKGGLGCVPLKGDRFSTSYDYYMYSDQGKLPVDRHIGGVYIGMAPDTIISKRYLQARYKNLSLIDDDQKSHHNPTIDFKALRVEREAMFKLMQSLANDVSNDEIKYRSEALMVTTVFTIICPLLLLALIRILMMIYNYVLYGRGSKVVLES